MPTAAAHRAARRKSADRDKFIIPPKRRRPADYLVSSRQACDYLGISKTTQYQWVADGLITPVRLGPRMLRFNIDDLDGLMS